MTALNKKHSNVKSMIIIGKNSAEVSGVRYIKFDSSQLITGFGVSSSNDYQFTLDHTVNSSFILMGGTSIKSTSSTRQMTYRWYDETNSQYLGSMAGMISSTQTGNANFSKMNPAYRQDAVVSVLSSDFGGADIVLSLRVISGTNLNYSWETTGFETWSGIPSLTVLKT